MRKIVTLLRVGVVTAVAAAATLANASPIAAASPSTITPASPNYSIDLTGDGTGRHWSGTERITFNNPSSLTLGTIYLRLWSNGLGGCSGGAIKVSALTGGTAGSMTKKCTVLPVNLNSPLTPGASATISMHLEISVRAKNDRFGYYRGLSMLGSAIPTLAIHDGGGWHLEPFIDLGESFYSVVGHYQVSLTTPASLDTPSTGVLSSTRSNPDGSQTRTYTASNVRDFEWAAGNLGSVQGTDAYGVRVRVSYVPGVYSAGAAQGALNYAIRSMNEFSRDFGSYPYPELDVVLSPLGYHGMEYPTFVLSDTRDISIAHEIAHQWWYGIVGNNQYHDPWLDESLSTWSQKLPGTPDQCTNRGWPSSNALLSNSMGYWASHPSQYWVLYENGTCMLDALVGKLGLSRVMSILRNYRGAHSFGNATTRDFKAAVQNVAQSVPGWNDTVFWQTWRVDG